jgi:uncharacterized membrane protein
MAPHEPPAELPRRSIGARLRGYFLTGLAVTAPIAVTIYLVWIMVDFVDRQVLPLLPDHYNPKTYGIPGVGLIIAGVALTLIGFLLLGRTIVELGESILSRMPVVRSIYSAAKQIFGTLFSQKSNAFRECVLIEYPRRGIWTIGFLTGATEGEVQEMVEEDLLNVFVPTTPNPTSGFLLFVPRSEVKMLVMSVEDGIKMVMSGGIITPPAPVRPDSASPASLTAES